ETGRTPLRRRADTTDGAARSCVRPPGGPAAEPPFCQPLVPEPAGTPTSHLSRHRGPLAKPGPLQKESQSIPHAQTNSPLASYKCVHTKAREREREGPVAQQREGEGYSARACRRYPHLPAATRRAPSSPAS